VNIPSRGGSSPRPTPINHGDPVVVAVELAGCVAGVGMATKPGDCHVCNPSLGDQTPPTLQCLTARERFYQRFGFSRSTEFADPGAPGLRSVLMRPEVNRPTTPRSATSRPAWEVKSTAWHGALATPSERTTRSERRARPLRGQSGPLERDRRPLPRRPSSHWAVCSLPYRLRIGSPGPRYAGHECVLQRAGRRCRIRLGEHRLRRGDDW
jgi:hypothetical protein